MLKEGCQEGSAHMVYWKWVTFSLCRTHCFIGYIYSGALTFVNPLESSIYPYKYNLNIIRFPHES